MRRCGGSGARLHRRARVRDSALRCGQTQKRTGVMPMRFVRSQGPSRANARAAGGRCATFPTSSILLPHRRATVWTQSTALPLLGAPLRATMRTPRQCGRQSTGRRRRRARPPDDPSARQCARDGRPASPVAPSDSRAAGRVWRCWWARIARRCGRSARTSSRWQNAAAHTRRRRTWAACVSFSVLRFRPRQTPLSSTMTKRSHVWPVSPVRFGLTSNRPITRSFSNWW